jgi:hypothetical protein
MYYVGRNRALRNVSTKQAVFANID